MWEKKTISTVSLRSLTSSFHMFAYILPVCYLLSKWGTLHSLPKHLPTIKVLQRLLSMALWRLKKGKATFVCISELLIGTPEDATWQNDFPRERPDWIITENGFAFFFDTTFFSCSWWWVHYWCQFLWICLSCTRGISEDNVWKKSIIIKHQS